MQKKTTFFHGLFFINDEFRLFLKLEPRGGNLERKKIKNWKERKLKIRKKKIKNWKERKLNIRKKEN